jgi:hypothetical protein
MYYIGSHWGYIDDGYVCSSNRMRNAYKRRKEDFKRRILSLVYDRNLLLEIEQKWLSLVKKRSKYYNLNFDIYNPWWHDEKRNLEVREKLSANHWSKNPEICDSIREKISFINKGRTAPNKGIPWTAEQREKYLKSLKGHKKPERTLEHRMNISKNSTRLQREEKIGMHGKTHTENTLKLMSENNAMKNPKYIEKVKTAKKNIKWLINTNNVKKMAIPGTDKWDILIADGYVPINKEL